MDSIIKFILNKSKLDISLIRIRNATNNTFLMGIEAKVTGTGLVPALMQPMVVDLTYQGRCFGKLGLPETKTSPSGTTIKVIDQEIQILDMDSFKAFVNALTNDDELVLMLDNGDCSIKALGLTGHCTYKKEVQLKGMAGPPIKLKETTSSTNTVIIHNHSVLEVAHGITELEIQDKSGNVIAELKGPLELKRGKCDAKMNIIWKGVQPSSREGVLVGRSTEGNAWTSETVKYIRTPLQFTTEFLGVCQG